MPDQPGERSPAEQAPPPRPMWPEPPAAPPATPSPPLEPATLGGPQPAEPASAQPAGPAPAQAVQPAPEPPTDGITVPRWTGSAAVPPPAERLGWRSRRRKTLEFALDEREALEAGPPTPPYPATPIDLPAPPVDPWADASPVTWPDPAFPAPPVTPPVPAAPPVPATPGALPPTRAFPPVLPPPHAPRPIPPPPAPRRSWKRSRSAAPRRPAGPPAPPPGWRPPPGWVPKGYELRRRRRQWPWRLTMLLLTFGCCCACPAYFIKPVYDQYPAAVSLPAEAAGLALRDDQDSEQTARALRDEVRAAHLLAEDVFAGVYSAGANRVTVFGATGFRLTPQSDLEAEFTELTEQYRLGEATDVEAGAPGGYLRCAVGETDEDDLVLCAWADHGSLGVATFSAGSLTDSADIARELRTTLIARG